MERIDLSTLSDRQLQMHAYRAQNDHWNCAKLNNERGMVAALAEYYRVRVEQDGRRVAKLRTESASLNDLAYAENDQALHITQLNYWSGVADGQQAVAV